ncbi:MAG: TonB family protein, partial [Ignavibacteriaceae bacterium]
MRILLTLLLVISSSLLIFPKNDSSDCEKLEKLIQSRGEQIVEELPQIVGGPDSLLTRLKYPQEALKNNIQGKVIVKFIIDTNGYAICPKIESKLIGYGCEDEAIRVIRTAHFIPAI